MDATKKLAVNSPLISTQTIESVVDAHIINAINKITAPLQATHFAVACSGGVDSAMLALHAVLWARKKSVNLHLFHVHHGLQQRAEGWVSQVHQLAQSLGVACHTLRVHVDLTQGDGMESAARDARYNAFKQLCSLTGVRHVFLGHHLDDQAETVLLRLLRGAGPTGMGAMAPLSERDAITYLRPLLGIARADLIAVSALFAQQTGWKPVWDPTNLQDDYTRGALRERLVPHLNARWLGWQQILSRHASQSQETAAVLDEVAAADLASLDLHATDQSFDLALWRKLSAARQALVVRYWLAQQGLKMPTQARLHDVLRQLRQLHALGFDRQMRVKHDNVFITCRRGRVFLSSLTT